jgi:heat shock protein HslJ
VALVVLVSAGCGDDGDDADDGGSAAGTAPEAADLDGSTFTVTDVEGQEVVEGSTITIDFAEGLVVAAGGCNTLRGGYTVEDGVLVVDVLASTQMACDEPLMAQDDWIGALLESGPRVTLDGDTLTLSGGDVTLTAEREAQ